MLQVHRGEARDLARRSRGEVRRGESRCNQLVRASLRWRDVPAARELRARWTRGENKGKRLVSEVGHFERASVVSTLMRAGHKGKEPVIAPAANTPRWRSTLGTSSPTSSAPAKARGGVAGGEPV